MRDVFVRIVIGLAFFGAVLAPGVIGATIAGYFWPGGAWVVGAGVPYLAALVCGLAYAFGDEIVR